MASIFLLCLATLLTPSFTQSIGLQAAAPYAVVAGGPITNTGATEVFGSIAPSGSLVGFPPGTLTGSIETNAATLKTIQADAISARQGASIFPSIDFSVFFGDVLGNGQLLQTGIYHFDDSAIIEGDLTLNATGVYVFQIEANLTALTGATMNLEGGTEAGNVWWIVGESANLEAMVDFKGNILAASNITLGAGAAIDGGLFAGDSIVLDNNKVGLIGETEPSVGGTGY